MSFGILCVLMIVSSDFYFYMHVLFVQLLFTLLVTLMHVRLLRVFNKYSILNNMNEWMNENEIIERAQKPTSVGLIYRA